MSLKGLDEDCRNNLYKLWNRISSGSYMALSVGLVEILEKGNGLRPLGILAVADGIAQLVVRNLLEPALELIFHEAPMGTGRTSQPCRS